MDEAIVSAEAKTTDSSPSSAMVLDEVGPLASFLNTDRYTESPKLQTIVDYFKSTEKDLTDITLLHNVRQVEARMGLPKLGETRLNRLYGYVKLQSQMVDIEKQMKEIML